MQHGIREGNNYKVEKFDTLKVEFDDGYLVLFNALPKSFLRAREIRNVQLRHNGVLIAQYDGVIERSPALGKYKEGLSPHALKEPFTLGIAEDMLAYWEGALRYLGQLEKGIRKNPAEVDTNPDIYRASAIASHSVRDFKHFKRHIEQERQHHERRH